MKPSTIARIVLVVFVLVPLSFVRMSLAHPVPIGGLHPVASLFLIQIAVIGPAALAVLFAILMFLFACLGGFDD